MEPLLLLLSYRFDDLILMLDLVSHLLMGVLSLTYLPAKKRLVHFVLVSQVWELLAGRTVALTILINSLQLPLFFSLLKDLLVSLVKLSTLLLFLEIGLSVWTLILLVRNSLLGAAESVLKVELTKGLGRFTERIAVLFDL